MYFIIFFFNDTATTEIYTLSLHDALPICLRVPQVQRPGEEPGRVDREVQLGVERDLAGPLQERQRGQHGQADRSEEHTSELQSRQYLVCRLLLEKKTPIKSLSH